MRVLGATAIVGGGNGGLEHAAAFCVCVCWTGGVQARAGSVAKKFRVRM